jgi:hypothetical protein
VSNARRLYAVPGTVRLPNSYLVHSTCNTRRKCHPSATGGLTRGTEAEQVKDGPGDVCYYLRFSFSNSAEDKCVDRPRTEYRNLTSVFIQGKHVKYRRL